MAVDASEFKDFSDWITFTLEMVVSDPDSLKIQLEKRGEKVCIWVTGPGYEVSKIFGKDNQNFQALHRLAIAVAKRIGFERTEIFVKNNETQRARAV